MSTFGGIVDEIHNVSIDRFDGMNLQSTAYFLSHCHTDHMVGLQEEGFKNVLEKNPDIFLYCSEISYQILLNTSLRRIKSNIKMLHVHEPRSVRVPGSSHYPRSQNLTVSTIPAGHCPGSVMFLLESSSATVLYTGDIRVAEGDIQKFKQLRRDDGSVKHIDVLYLDTTFLNQRYSYFPLRRDSGLTLCKMIEEWTKQSDGHYIQLLTPAKYGYEYLYVEIFRNLNMKVHVTTEIYYLYQNVAEVGCSLTLDPSATKVHACEVSWRRPKKQLFCLNAQHQLRSIKCSAMWYSSQVENEKEIFNVNCQFHRIVYSSHSSHNELVDIIRYLCPKKIVPCVIPERSSAYEINKLLETIQADFCTLKPNTREPDHLATIPQTLLFKRLKRKSREWGKEADAKAAMLRKHYEDIPSPPRPTVR